MPTSVPISPQTAATLQSLAARTGRPVEEVLAAVVEEYRRREGVPIVAIPGVDPADIWAAAAEAEAGQVLSHEEVFARLRER